MLKFGVSSWLALALYAGAAAAVPVETATLPSPYYREAEFYRYQSQPLLALGSLLAAQQQDLPDQDRNAVDLLLSQLYRDYELPGQAADSLQRASGTGVGSLRGKAWWELALQRYRRGDYARASAALTRSTGLLPYELEQKRPLLQAQILLAMNRNAEAAALLKAWQPIQQQEPYARYNVGVALVRAGDLLQGAGLLDSVGTMAAPDTELQSLRDQANLAMGYGFLRADHGATARPLFRRVRLDGPYSNLALLGAGWAELAPDGTPQQNLYLSPVGCVEDPTRVLPESLLILRRPPRDACDRERTFKSRVFFEQASGAGSEAERYRRALIPWQTLVRRSPADPAVQEALLALPYAYSRLKGREQAIEHYRSAISRYETERQHLQRTARAVREAPLLAAPAVGSEALPAWALPRTEDALVLGSLMASDPFQAALRDLQSLHALTRALKIMETRIEAYEPGRNDRIEASGEAETEIAADTNRAASTAAAVPDKPGADPQRITYFGVFDFLPPPAETTDAPPAATAAVETEPAPTSPPRRRRAQDEETPVLHQTKLRTRLDRLQAQVLAAADAHEKSLRAMGLVEIAIQQERLDIYLAQARFSLARLLDPAVADSTGP